MTARSGPPEINFGRWHLSGAVMTAAILGAGILLALSPLLNRPKLVPAQRARIENLAPGKILVAQRKLRDPNFAETVVLLANYGEAGAMGVVLNRRTKLPLSSLFSDLKPKKPLSDPVYAGGPVEPTTGIALLRSDAALDGSHQIFPHVYLIAERALLEKTLAEGKESSVVRVYLGYCGWGPDQLEREIEAGAWQVFPADAARVFDPEPDTLWERLIRKTEMQIAAASFTPPLPPVR